MSFPCEMLLLSGVQCEKPAVKFHFMYGRVCTDCARDIRRNHTGWDARCRALRPDGTWSTKRGRSRV